METVTDTWWVLALAFKYNFSSENLVSLVVLIAIAWLAMSIFYWNYPGGPAWGKYRWRNFHRRTSELNRNIITIPGPTGLPFIGSIHTMSNLAHRWLSQEAEIHHAKRLMAFSLGDTRVIVTANPDVAKDILTSSVFADRPIKESAYSLMFHRAIGFAPYGSYWSHLRRITAAHLFCPKQINESEIQRFHLASQMVTTIKDFKEIRVRGILKRASLYSMMNSVFGLEYELNSATCESDELAELIEEGYDLLGKVNWSDHLPFLSRFDLQKIRFRSSTLVPKVNRFVGRIIEQHKDQKVGKKGDFVDVMLSLKDPDKLSESDMIAVLWEMIFRGTDTVAVLMEWILARLVLHPEIQSKVHQELDQVVGKSRAVTESDIPALPYLQAVIKEVLRLHPPGPLLSWARLAIFDSIIDGRHVPAGTTAMVNIWAIGRDESIWPQPMKFCPERFIENEFSVSGSDLRLAPFGSGRRSCPGKTLGLVTATFWIATLLHEFNWSSADFNSVDLSEILRLSCEMKFPLNVIVNPRRS